MTDSRTHYCLGFAFNDDLTQVALLQKNRPAWLAGKWTGIGGHVEAGETAQKAVAREVEEEAGVKTPATQWHFLDHRTSDEWILDVFTTTLDLAHIRACTEEPIQVYDLEALPEQLGPMVKQDLDAAVTLLRALNPGPVASRRRRPG
jgi:8-oxo-dGTP pyrophosphatase MutT (NUDIX family)